jgi:hypothetical protein
LALIRHFAIACKGRQNFFMPEVLAPRFEFFWRFTGGFTKPDKGISKAVRVEVRQASADESFSKDCANGRGAAPVIPFQTSHFKLARCTQRNARFGKKQIVITP